MDLNVNAMDAREVCAEKIRAASDRARYRDFYDLVILFDKFKFDIRGIVDIIKRKKIRKPITHDSIARNWKVARREQEAELSRVYYSCKVGDKEVAQLLKRLRVNVLK
jgi:predicted nucleotidyltransferase component of viral defense system